MGGQFAEMCDEFLETGRITLGEGRVRQVLRTTEPSKVSDPDERRARDIERLRTAFSYHYPDFED